jgi:hypothetical protein
MFFYILGVLMYNQHSYTQHHAHKQLPQHPYANLTIALVDEMVLNLKHLMDYQGNADDVED